MIRDNVNIPLDKMNLSFAGCGFLGIYHVGVASCFREYLPEIVHNKFSGASVGALVATAMALDCSLADSTSDLLKVAIKARSRALGPFHPSFDVNKILYDALVKALPEDAHKRVNGRLFISVTRVSDGKNKIISRFDSKDDLIQAIQCSCFIPCWSGILPPKFHGVAYMDGGFSDNLPIVDDYTVTISPFAGESDICPQENTFNYMQVQLSNTSFSISPGNLYRITRILFPPHPEEMSKMCVQGFNDALRFLQRTNKISCLRCVAIQSSFLLADSGESEAEEEIEEETEESEEETEDEDEPNEVDVESNSDSGYEQSYDDSNECKSCQEMFDLHSLPDPVAKAIQEAIDSVNKGLINWIFKHRPVRVLSLLTVPVTLPFDLALVFAVKSLRLIPALKNELKRSLINLIAFILKKDKFGRKKTSARFSCQLAITEFGAKEETPISSPPLPKRKESVFTMDSSFSRKKSSARDAPRSTGPRLERMETMPPLTISSATDLRSRLKEEKKTKRNSYAGKEFSYSTSNLSRSASCHRERRKSVADMFGAKSPSNERVTQRMNFGFTVDLPTDRLPSNARRASSRRGGEARDRPADESNSNNNQVVDDVLITVLQSLGEGVDPQEVDLDAKEVTNKALSIEKEYFEKFAKSELGDTVKNAKALDEIMDVASNNQALMAFYYLDEKKRVKVTEIFNIPENLEEKEAKNSRSRKSEHQNHKERSPSRSATGSNNNFNQDVNSDFGRFYDTDNEEDGLPSAGRFSSLHQQQINSTHSLSSLHNPDDRSSSNNNILVD